MQWCAGKCITTGSTEGRLICGICQFLIYKYSYRGIFQVTNRTGSQISWKFNNGLSWTTLRYYNDNMRSHVKHLKFSQVSNIIVWQIKLLTIWKTRLFHRGKKGIIVLLIWAWNTFMLFQTVLVLNSVGLSHYESWKNLHGHIWELLDLYEDLTHTHLLSTFWGFSTML